MKGEVLKVKTGDIVYFKESHTARYSTNEYHFSTEVPYVVSTPGSGSCTIDAPDGTSHFIFSSGGYDKLIIQNSLPHPFDPDVSNEHYWFRVSHSIEVLYLGYVKFDHR